ncbi:MAG: hypothetical protein M3Q71_15935, partial [Chloroflexota bacterium]|nr:hypothetical protein [Chloroflexota bacterium]
RPHLPDVLLEHEADRLGGFPSPWLVSPPASRLTSGGRLGWEGTSGRRVYQCWFRFTLDEHTDRLVAYPEIRPDAA